uniref:Uncharacterized protein n=1 Tax=Anguilla anguilla TaxID=7936 RepID=A0A0E9RI23_ANGAN
MFSARVNDLVASVSLFMLMHSMCFSVVVA